MKRLVALAALALVLASCAPHRPEPAAPPPAPASAPASEPVPAPAPGPSPAVKATPAAPSRRLPPPPEPPAQAQHAPLWLVRGAVVDSRTGRPLVNAAVLVISRRDTVAAASRQPSIATGADGRFTLDFPSPGDFTIKVAAIGYRFKTTVVHVSATGNVPYRVFRLSRLPLSHEIPVQSSPNPQDSHAP